MPERNILAKHINDVIDNLETRSTRRAIRLNEPRAIDDAEYYHELAENPKPYTSKDDEDLVQRRGEGL